MRKLLALLGMCLFVAGPAAVSWSQGRGLDPGGGDEQGGMTDEEFKAFILQLIERITADCAAEGPNVDGASSPHVVDMMLKRLETQRVTVYFQDTSFGECLDFLRDVTGLNIVVSPRARDIVAAGNYKINLRLRDIRLKNLLTLMLGVSEELTYGIKNDVLYISTREEWLGVVDVMIIYTIHEIVYLAPNFPAPAIGLSDFVPWQK